jgi:hypothetical protein
MIFHTQVATLIVNESNFSCFSLVFLAILQRTTVNVGQIKIQGVATCLFLCMDSCGVTYGSVSTTIIYINE